MNENVKGQKQNENLQILLWKTKETKKEKKKKKKVKSACQQNHASGKMQKSQSSVTLQS